MIKIRFVSKALCLVVFSLFVQMGLYAQNEKPFVVPELKEWKGSEGAFIPSADMRVFMRRKPYVQWPKPLPPTMGRCSVSLLK